MVAPDPTREALILAEKALAPLAEIAREYSVHEDGSLTIFRDFDVLGAVGKFRLGDCRKAASALTAIQAALRNHGQPSPEEAPAPAGLTGEKVAEKAYGIWLRSDAFGQPPLWRDMPIDQRELLAFVAHYALGASQPSAPTAADTGGAVREALEAIDLLTVAGEDYQRSNAAFLRDRMLEIARQAQDALALLSAVRPGEAA